jgi:hypothetical protein
VVSASLATSIVTAAGAWAVVPMGHLDQPLNTFWQLFFRRSATTPWSNQASELAVATNGGLVLATNGGRSLAVGIRPTNYLGFSPLITTSDARRWAPATPIAALVDEPDALAMDAAGGALALVSDGKSTSVLESPGALAGWTTLVSEKELASTPPGRACGIVSLTAVAYLGAQEVVGASCRRGGVAGIFTGPPGSWRLAGPGLRPLGLAGTDMLGLQARPRGLCALLSGVRRGGTDLVAACTHDEGTSWRVSPAVPLTGQKDLVAFGPASRTGLFALISGPDQVPRLVVLDPAGTTWAALPPPPEGTATVAFAPSGGADALVVDDTSFADWRLAPGSHRWRRTQHLQVAIQFGSSS